MPDEVAWDNINLIKNMEKNEEYIEVLRVGIEKFSELQNSGLLDILKGRLDMSEMKYVKSSVNNLFDGTGLFQALNCLSGKSSLEDLTTGIDGISTFLEIAKGLRRIAAYKNVTDSVIPKIIDTMIELKEAVKSLSNPANGNRTRREAKPTIELPADSVDSLSQGAELFEKLLAIAAKKEEFMQISKFEKKVNQEIALIRMPPMYSLWTDSMRAKFNHMLQEISDLEKLAAKFTKPSESVSAISALFERADKIVGVPNFDTSLFASPMATTLRASNDSDIQAAGNALHNLRDIELQYSSGHFKSAEEAAKSLRDYFKIFFDPSMAPIIQGGQPRILPGALSAATTPSAEQDNGFDALFFIVIGCVLCVIVIIILLIVCIIRLKGRGAKKEPEGVWRHLRFLEEGILLPHFGIEYTPMHLAIVDRRTDDVKKRIKNGAYVNVHSIGKVRETPLHTAVTLDFAEIVTLLLKNGADPNAKDQNYESPKDRAKNNRAEIQKIFQDFEKKTFPMGHFHVFIEPELRKTLEAAPSLQENIVEKYEEATHFVVKNKTDEILDLDLIKEQEGDNGLASLLVQIFSPRLIMTSTWLEEGALRSTDFQNDYKFRVKKVRFQGEEYKTLYKIHEEFHKMEIPYLCNATVFFYQASLHTLDWKYYKRIATYLGATVTEVFPFVEEATRQHQHLYYREDVGNTLVIYMEEHAVELDAKHGPLRSQKSYAFMELNEFIAFLLLHKTVGSKSAVSTAKSKRKGESREAAKDVSMTQDVSSSHDNLSKTGEP
uniref:ANK_REP_REGION domain-containing protein n=1 Tax=Caenorhabditis japonica TaxID=281687 RepID=A0A8R1HMJ1_CAEJA